MDTQGSNVNTFVMADDMIFDDGGQTELDRKQENYPKSLPVDGHFLLSPALDDKVNQAKI